MKKTVKNSVILKQMKEMVLAQPISDDKASDSDHSTDVWHNHIVIIILNIIIIARS